MWPGTRQKRSQMDSARPSAVVAPSFWYADVEHPQRKSAGNCARRRVCTVSGGLRVMVCGCEFVSAIPRKDAPALIYPKIGKVPTDFRSLGCPPVAGQLQAARFS